MSRVRRTDLEILDVDYKKSFIAGRLIKNIVMGDIADKSGDLYYTPVQADGSVTAGRADGATLASRVLANTTVAYACTKDEDRVLLDYDQSRRRGMENVDKIGGKSIKKTMRNNYEDQLADLLLGAAVRVDVTTAPNGGDDIIKAVSLQKENLEVVAGKTVFACCTKVYNKIIRRTEIENRMTFNGVMDQAGNIVRGMKEQVLAEILNVDEVIVGSNKNWGTTASYDERAVLLKVPEMDIDENDLQSDPYFGARLQILAGENQTDIEIYSWDNDKETGHQYDGLGYSELKVLNAEGAVTFEAIS